MSLAYKIVEDLAPLSRHFASYDYDKAINYLQQIIPFTIHKFSSKDINNGWIIPPKYSVKRATIKKNGLLIYDGKKHPLAVICHSTSFKGKVDLDSLRQHLWYDRRYNDAIPYHFRHSYRPWDRDWGFCVTRNFFDSLDEGNYEIDLEVEDDEPELKVLDYYIAGKFDIEFVFVAHLDHPGMANDDVSGCAVGVELFKLLSSWNTKFSYRLLLVQEIIGSQYYLNKVGRIANEGLFLEMLGVDTPLSLQQSQKGESLIEWALKNALKQVEIDAPIKGFRELIGNDEIVFETYGIPMASLTRFPYPEYHCDRDNISIIIKERLNEAVTLLVQLLKGIENEIYIRKKFEGVICLSNPDYNLYVDPGQPAFGMKNPDPLRKLMEYISLMPCGDFIGKLCDRFGLDKDSALDYLKRWEKLGFISMH